MAVYWRSLGGKYLKGHGKIWVVEEVETDGLVVVECDIKPVAATPTTIEFAILEGGERKAILPAAVGRYFKILKPWDRIWEDAVIR